jgi:hypothetical protein
MVIVHYGMAPLAFNRSIFSFCFWYSASPPLDLAISLSAAVNGAR